MSTFRVEEQPTSLKRSARRSRGLGPWIGLGLLIAVATASSAGGWSLSTTTHPIPVLKTPGFLLYVMPGQSRVVSTTFIGSYDNRGTESNAASAKFVLTDLGRGLSWTVHGSDLGWRGEGAFGPTSLQTHALSGAVASGSGEPWSYWETSTGGLPPRGLGPIPYTLSARFEVEVFTPIPAPSPLP